MSSYRGRTGPNFSEYLDSLNTGTPTYDQDQLPNGDDIKFENELAMFTNADFVNFDILSESGAPGLDLIGDIEVTNNIQYEELLAGQADPRNCPVSCTDISSLDPAPFYPTNYNTPIQPAPPAKVFATAPPAIASPATLSYTNEAITTTTPAKSKRDTPPSQLNIEDQNRQAADEDKRRRNTAASARFRIKKKQREQALERTAKDLDDKNAALEARIQQLEMENKWLKELVVEKNGASGVVKTKEEVEEAYQKFRRESEEREEVGKKAVKKGVGTKP